MFKVLAAKGESACEILNTYRYCLFFFFLCKHLTPILETEKVESEERKTKVQDATGTMLYSASLIRQLVNGTIVAS